MKILICKLYKNLIIKILLICIFRIKIIYMRRNLLFDGRARRKVKVHLLMKKTCGVTTNVYSKKTLEKTKRGMRILKRRVRELFTHMEGISTPRARHEERQSLIECAIKIT